MAGVVKVILNGTTLIDHSDSTIDPTKVLSSYVGYEGDGDRIVGTATGGGTGAVAVVDVPDSHGGIEKRITAVDISDTTATAADVVSGKYFYTANGTKTAGTASGGSITVNGMASRTEPSGEITITSTIKEYAFSECANITKVTINGETVLRGYSFKGCTSLVTLDAPTITTFASAQHFIGDTALVNVNLPNATVLGNNAFQGCTSLTFLDLPKVTGLNYIRCLYGCSSLKTLILRYTGGVVPINNDVFTNTPFASGGSGGTVYVPQSLISSYQIATNWSTLYNAGTCTFSAIEGSVYE